MLALIIIIGVIGLDQFIKLQIVAHIAPMSQITVINKLFYITNVKNFGIAFSMFKNKNTFFIVIIATIILVLVYCLIKFYNRNIYMTICLAFIIGGAVGNLIDRIKLGYVVDYVHISFFPAIFNLADCAIVVGAIVLALMVTFDKNIKF